MFQKLPFCVDYRALPDAVADLPELQLHRDGANVTVLCEGEIVSSGSVSMWLSHASAFWARVYGRPHWLFVYPQTGWLPRGDDLHVTVAKAAAPELMDLAAALLTEGKEHEARVMAHLVLYRACAHDMPPDILAHAPVARPLRAFTAIRNDVSGDHQSCGCA